MRKRSTARRTAKGVDARIEKSKQAVLAATYDLLTETGLGGFSVDAVSARSGVAKTTIYRHWPSRSALVLDACSQLSPRREAPDTGSLKDDLAVLVRDLAHRLQTARWPSVLPSIIDAGERDSQIAKMHSRLHAALMSGFSTAVEQARARGEIPSSLGTTFIVAQLVGPLFYRRWFSREQIDERFVKQVLNFALVRSK